MEKNNSLSDQLMSKMADLLNVENQLVESLPKIVKVTQSSALKLALEEYIEIAKEHIYRLNDIFSNIGQNPKREICETIKGFIKESEILLNQAHKDPEHDLAIINAVAQVEKYEINEYSTACRQAEDLGHTRIVELLKENCDEERAMNFHLNELAQGIINIQAIKPQGSWISQPSGFYIPEAKFKRSGIKKKKNKDNSRFTNEENPNTHGID